MEYAFQLYTQLPRASWRIERPFSWPEGQTISPSWEEGAILWLPNDGMGFRLRRQGAGKLQAFVVPRCGQDNWEARHLCPLPEECQGPKKFLLEKFQQAAWRKEPSDLASFHYMFKRCYLGQLLKYTRQHFLS